MKVKYNNFKEMKKGEHEAFITNKEVIEFKVKLLMRQHPDKDKKWCHKQALKWSK